MTKTNTGKRKNSPSESKSTAVYCRTCGAPGRWMEIGKVWFCTRCGDPDIQLIQEVKDDE